MNKQDQITEKEMTESIQRSGYPLEQRIEAKLEKAGYYVMANTAYPDPLTGKSREVDIEALIGVQVLGKRNWVFPYLVIECENNHQPSVFFLRNQ